MRKRKRGGECRGCRLSLSCTSPSRSGPTAALFLPFCLTQAKGPDTNPRERTKKSRCTNSVQRFSEHDRAKSEEAGWELPKSDDTWGHVLVHARGVVGETALHLLFLLHSTAHRRLTKLLVPLLARQKTPDVDGVEVGAQREVCTDLKERWRDADEQI